MKYSFTEKIHRALFNSAPLSRYFSNVALFYCDTPELMPSIVYVVRYNNVTEGTALFFKGSESWLITAGCHPAEARGWVRYSPPVGVMDCTVFVKSGTVTE